jgi:hypothetical protein
MQRAKPCPRGLDYADSENVTSPHLLKLGLFVLLTVNSAVFALSGTAAEGLDSMAWLTLLILFELETAYAKRLSTRRALLAVHTVRMCAGAAVVAAAVGYVRENAWLDAVNAWVWIAVVVLLELKVRFPQAFPRHRTVTEASAGVLYLGLGAIVAVWAWQGEWFEAYDAALWIVAFVIIELNILARSSHP